MTAVCAGVQRFNIGLVDAARWRKKVNKISKDLNELFWGVVPFRLKKTIIVGSPVWVRCIVVAKRIEDRTITCSEVELHAMLKKGKDDLPYGFVGGTRDFVPRYELNSTFDDFGDDDEVRQGEGV